MAGFKGVEASFGADRHDDGSGDWNAGEYIFQARVALVFPEDQAQIVRDRIGSLSSRGIPLYRRHCAASALTSRLGGNPVPAIQLAVKLVCLHACNRASSAEEPEVMGPEFGALLQDQIDLLAFRECLADRDAGTGAFLAWPGIRC